MKKNSYIPALDALRFISAIFVAIFHWCFWSSLPNSTPGKALHQVTSFSEIASISHLGWVGVEIFFVISGLVIAKSSEGAKPLQFLFNRIQRLYPAVWICSTVTLMVVLLTNDSPFRQIIVRYLFTISILPSSTGWIDGVYWTLVIEAFFYLLVFVFLCSKYFSVYRLTLFLIFISFPYVTATLLSSKGFNYIFIENYLLLINSLPIYVRLFFQFQYGCFFAVGVFISRVSSKPVNGLFYIVFPIAIVGGVEGVYLHAEAFSKASGIISNSSAPILLWLLSIVYIFVFINKGNNIIAGVFYSSLRVIGLMTYPFYLLHDVIGSYIIKYLVVAGVSKWVSLILGFLFIILISWYVCVKIEPIVRGKLREQLNRLNEKF